MLDYAANAVVHWPVEKIRSQLEMRCEAAGENPITRINELLQGESETELFWSKVKTNLQAGKIRLIFVADAIPPELRRIIEFLNVQMDPAEVLGLEVKQYSGEGLSTLVPRVIGQTAEAQQRKSAGQEQGGTWDERSFFAALEERNGAAVARVGREIFNWARPRGRIWFGSGKRSGSFGLTIPVNGGERYLFATYTYGAVEIYFQWLKNSLPFDSEPKRRELLGRFNAIESINLPADSITRRPSIKLADLIPPQRLSRFIDVLTWAIAEILATTSNPPPRA
jgi:hypothetical protein